MEYIQGLPTAVKNSSGTQPPAHLTPVGATDCHMHIFDHRFPVISGRNPPEGTVDDYRKLMTRLGISRCVVVSPSSYGTDNRCLVDALKTLGDKARGVAAIGPDTSRSELQALHDAGVRGVRVNYGRVAGTSFDDVRRVSRQIADLPWALHLHAPADEIVEREKYLADLPCPLVIEHFGLAPQPGGENHPVTAALKRLTDGGNTYTKLSHLRETEARKYHHFTPLAKLLINHMPERILWGSDWVHGTMEVKPDDAYLLDLLTAWCPSEDVRCTILVENPSRLYWSA